MSKSQIETLEALFNERYDIMVSFDNKADEVYYKGMLSVLNGLGYETIVREGVVSIVKM